MPATDHRVIIGCIVTEPLGESSVIRNPLAAYGLIHHVFKGEPFPNPDVSVTLEDEKLNRTENGGMEIVTGTVQSMENFLERAKREAPQSEKREGKQPRPALKRSTVIVCVGSKELCDAFVRVWTVHADPAPTWVKPLRDALAQAKPRDGFWLNLKGPAKLSRFDAGQAMAHGMIQNL